MNNIYVYEIFLDELLVVNSGDMKFKTESEATKDAQQFIANLIKNDSEFNDSTEDDFDINISEISEDDFTKGW